MMTITIKDGKLSKTDFNSTQDLFIFLRKELSPLKLNLIDEDYLSEESLEKIRKSKNNLCQAKNKIII